MEGRGREGTERSAGARPAQAGKEAALGADRHPQRHTTGERKGSELQLHDQCRRQDAQATRAASESAPLCSASVLSSACLHRVRAAPAATLPPPEGGAGEGGKAARSPRFDAPFLFALAAALFPSLPLRVRPFWSVTEQ
jgi:hypothetical protein